MHLGITGHQRLQRDDAWIWVRGALAAALAKYPAPWTGLSSLAIGADQLFAELALARGCELQVVLPFAAYAATFAPGAHLARFRTLLARASDVKTLRDRATREESYLAAGQWVVDHADQLIAIWDGAPAAGLGGTGDIVGYALLLGKQVLHLNPQSREVRQLRRPAHGDES